MFIQFTLNFEKPDKTRFEVLDLMINVCNFLNGTYNKLKIPRLVLKELNKQKYFPKKCPIEAVSCLERFPLNMKIILFIFRIPIILWRIMNLMHHNFLCLI